MAGGKEGIRLFIKVAIYGRRARNGRVLFHCNLMEKEAGIGKRNLRFKI